MRILGAIILAFLGGISILAALAGFFANSLVDSFWGNLAHSVSTLFGASAGSTLASGHGSGSIWPLLLMLLLGALMLAGALLLVATGGRRRRKPYGSGSPRRNPYQAYIGRRRP
jgi:cytosine/uracil/thiamine/allantoin permease